MVVEPLETAAVDVVLAEEPGETVVDVVVVVMELVVVVLELVVVVVRIVVVVISLGTVEVVGANVTAGTYTGGGVGAGLYFK